ncbi:uncharacterized protein LOC111031619 [Myzus persicae]|uniref:uncharacterized protein LOC111031619 n=1 Tax=Myzus persicae TaxID=13164 RepID=UPI000B937F11|nr:uncharacterized protein LOC111031619 [Myzus persicae]
MDDPNEAQEDVDMEWWHNLEEFESDSDSDSSTDESEDDGLEDAEENSDPEEIIVDRTYRLPQVLDPQLIPNGEDDEGVGEVGRRRHDRHRVSSRVSRGDDDESFNRRTYAFRKYLRSLDTTPEMTEELFQGGFRPEIIMGMMMKRRRICYFAQWVRNFRRETYPLEASVVKRYYPNLVIDFHQQMVLNKNRFEKI